MFNFASSSGGKGSGYIILQIIRVFNCIILATIGAASVVFMVVDKMPDAFTFFNDVSLAFVTGVCVLLILSEIELNAFTSWFADNWPAVGPNRGFTWLGITMIILGSHTLGRLSDPRHNFNRMTLPFWRLAMAAGVLGIVFGTVNIITSWLYKGADGHTARDTRNDGAVQRMEYKGYDEYESNRSNSIRSVRQEKKKSFFNFGKKEKTPEPAKPVISHPMSQNPPNYDVERGGWDEESIESRRSPIIPQVVRPPSAHHPALRNSASYSEASHMNRF